MVSNLSDLNVLPGLTQCHSVTVVTGPRSQCDLLMDWMLPGLAQRMNWPLKINWGCVKHQSSKQHATSSTNGFYNWKPNGQSH